jgi:hypothetical protein
MNYVTEGLMVHKLLDGAMLLLLLLDRAATSVSPARNHSWDTVPYFVHCGNNSGGK